MTHDALASGASNEAALFKSTAAGVVTFAADKAAQKLWNEIAEYAKIRKNWYSGDECGKVGDSLKPQNLMDELAQSGVKYSADDILMVTKVSDGKLMWLEKGNSSSGLIHIIERHAADFAKRGVNDIPGFLNNMLRETPIKTGMTKAGPYAHYLIEGKLYKLAFGTNGYIVSFMPLKN